MTYLESIADELAKMVLADQENLDDNVAVDLMSAAISASSATLQETFLTAVRIRRAEIRAHEALKKHQAKQQA